MINDSSFHFSACQLDLNVQKVSFHKQLLIGLFQLLPVSLDHLLITC